MKCKCQFGRATYLLTRHDTLVLLRSGIVAASSGDEVVTSELFVVDETVGNVKVVGRVEAVHGHGVTVLGHEVVHGHEAVGGRELVRGRETVGKVVGLLGLSLRLVGSLGVVDRLLAILTQGIMASLIDL